MTESQKKKKGLYVQDIKENQSIEGCFLVQSCSLLETKTGKPYLTISLVDKTGEIVARIWDNAEAIQKKCQPGSIVLIQGKSQSFKGQLQLNIKSTQKVDTPLDLSEFLMASPFDRQHMFQELTAMVSSIENRYILELINLFLSDASFVDDFCAAPAAKNMHHAYIGGLLEHTLGLMRLANKVAGLYPNLDRSVLMAGVFFHDLGKIKEFTFDVPPFDYSSQGRLVGHMVLAIEMINEKVRQIEGFPNQLNDHIKHMVLSHHGCHEYGSPSLPMIREAFVLHFIDDLDAKMNYMDKLSQAVEGEGYEWTPYQRTLERFLFVRKGLDDSPNLLESQENHAEDNDDLLAEENRQQTLW